MDKVLQKAYLTSASSISSSDREAKQSTKAKSVDSRFDVCFDLDMVYALFHAVSGG